MSHLTSQRDINPSNIELTERQTSPRQALLPAWAGYLISTILVSIFYIKLLVWFGIHLEDGSWFVEVEPIAEGTYLFCGFFLSLLVMPIAWMMILGIQKIGEFTGRVSLIYFTVSGALAFFCVNCLACNPLPLDADDNFTGPQLIEIALHREGLYYPLCGFLFGGIYWLLSVWPTGRPRMKVDQSSPTSL